MAENKINKYLNFTKIEHTAFSLPLIFAGAWMGARGEFPDLSVMGLIVVAAVGARIFGMAFNRIFDRKIDAENPRTAGRELPTGTMTVSSALMVALSGLIVYLGACALLGRWCLILSPLPLIPLLGYSLLKRFTFLCHFGIGICLALAPLGAFVAASGKPDFTLPVILFSIFVFFWLSGADIIYALMDIESDRMNHIHSLPAKLGARGAQMIAGLVHLAAVIFLSAVLITTGAGSFSWFFLVVMVLIFIIMYIPAVPIPFRFFPLSTIAGIAGALAPMVA